MWNTGSLGVYIISADCSFTASVVGIIIGVTIAGIVLFVVLPIIICVVVWCCVAYAAGSVTRRRVRTHVVTTSAPSTFHVATSTTQRATAPPPPAWQPYPPAGYTPLPQDPTAGYTPLPPHTPPPPYSAHEMVAPTDYQPSPGAFQPQD